MNDSSQLIIIALQQRIGELVSSYETRIASLRAEVTQLSQKINDVQEYEEHLKNIMDSEVSSSK